MKVNQTMPMGDFFQPCLGGDQFATFWPEFSGSWSPRKPCRQHRPWAYFAPWLQGQFHVTLGIYKYISLGWLDLHFSLVRTTLALPLISSVRVSSWSFVPLTDTRTNLQSDINHNKQDWLPGSSSRLHHNPFVPECIVQTKRNHFICELKGRAWFWEIPTA